MNQINVWFILKDELKEDNPIHRIGFKNVYIYLHELIRARSRLIICYKAQQKYFGNVKNSNNLLTS